MLYTYTICMLWYNLNTSVALRVYCLCLYILIFLRNGHLIWTCISTYIYTDRNGKYLYNIGWREAYYEVNTRQMRPFTLVAYFNKFYVSRCYSCLVQYHEHILNNRHISFDHIFMTFLDFICLGKIIFH